MRILCLLAAVLLAACSSQPPQSTSYLLRSELATTSGSPQVDSGIALGNIRVANYIDQPGLVLATGDGKVRAARNYVWAEPLQVSLRRYLAAEISGVSGREIAATASATSKTRIDVSVDELHGNGAGEAVLVAYWEVTSAGQSNSFRFSERQALSGDGYDALVKAEEVLLKHLASAIAGSLPPP